MSLNNTVSLLKLVGAIAVFVSFAVVVDRRIETNRHTAEQELKAYQGLLSNNVRIINRMTDGLKENRKEFIEGIAELKKEISARLDIMEERQISHIINHNRIPGQGGSP